MSFFLASAFFTAVTFPVKAAVAPQVVAVVKRPKVRNNALIYKVLFMRRIFSAGLDGSLVVVDLAVEFVGDFVFADRILEVFPEVQADFRLTAEQSG